MTTERITIRLRPFEKVANDVRWTGAIENGAYVVRVGRHAHALRLFALALTSKRVRDRRAARRSESPMVSGSLKRPH
jgi:hypothetical protein